MSLEKQFKALARLPVKSQGRDTNNAVVYTRVSSKEQADNNASLETQLKFCAGYAERKGMMVHEYFGGTHESAKSIEC